MKIPYNENGRRNNSEKFVITATVTSWKTYYAAQVGFPAIKTRYNALGRVKARVDTMGNKTTMMTYRNESLGPNSGDVTTWLYDIASGCMTNKVYADGKGPTYSYTPDGKLEQRIWARGIITDYTYDGWNNLTNTVYSDNTPTVSLFYDAMGRQTEAHDAAGVTTFLYDSFGSLTNEIVIGVAGTNTIERFWDEYGRTAGYALNCTRQTTIGYDSATARIETMQVHESEGSTLNSPTPTQNSNCFVWSYYSGSDLKSSLAYPNGLTASWQYDANNQLLQVCNATQTNVISQYEYTYDAAGRRVQISRSGSAMSENRTDVYGYNNRGELISATKNAEIAEHAYAYDDIGNRLTSFDIGANYTYAANNLNQYTSISNSSLSASPGENFTPQFDDDGNQTLVKTATGVWQVQYNAENRPVLWEQGTNMIAMSYDRMGRRVTKNALRFVYNGYLQIASFDLSVTNSQLTSYNSQLFIWDPTEPVATRPLFWNHESVYSCYTHDGNKNVSEVIAEGGEIVAHYDYSPFGVVSVQYGVYAAANLWRFSSEYGEDETATMYYNYRHYEPSSGRWLNRDPIDEQADVKLFVFASNQSIIRTDFLGMFDDGGEKVCREVQYVYEYVPSEGYIVKEVCVHWETIKGHKDFPNNGTKCPFDYTKEDKDWKSRPETPWGIWKHFRSKEDVEESLEALMSKMREEKKCNTDIFERLLHQLQDYYSHYKPGWRWWWLGHLVGGHEPDRGVKAQEKRWPEAATATKEWVERWKSHCKLKCEDPCVWEYTE